MRHSSMARSELSSSRDALTAEGRSASSGRLKIFLGAAPGVGKTYAMLRQAQRRRGEGLNVVIGVVDVHGDEEMRGLAANLPALPPTATAYGNGSSSELDVDAVLKRKPQLVVVDELAYANAPGSRHEKRWQDVEELLQAGINVYTTMNVHDLESLNEIVKQITGVTVRETVPDLVLERAEQIELVDAAPEDVIARLRRGQIAVPESLEQDRQRFFSAGNLAALRELTMRAAAQRIDADVRGWTRLGDGDRPPPAQQRLLVLVGNSPEAARLVRLGKRLSGSARAWIVAHVSRPDTAAKRSGDHITPALKLAAELGAETVLLSGHDLVTEIIDCAAEHHVSQIVIGRSRRPWRFLRASLATALLRNTKSLDVTIASIDDSVAPERWTRPARPRLTHRGWKGYAEAAIATGCCALIAWFLDPLLETANLGLVFLTGVLIAAGRAGVGPALFASGLSFIVFNFFYTEPRRSFSVTAEQDVLTLGFFLLVAVVTGQLAARVRQQIDTIQAHTRRLASLENFSRRLTGIVGQDDFAGVLVEYLRSTLALDAIVLFRDHKSELVVAAGDPGRDGLTEPELAAAHWAFDHREPAGRGTGTLPAGGWFFIPLVGGRQALGVLGAKPNDGRRALDAEQQRLLFALRDQAGTALERLQLATTMEHARLLTETEKLRTALLSSVSHDLRTPLVSIKGATTALLELDDTLAATDKRELLENVLEETDRLNRYVQNLLDMTRLGYGAVTPQSDWRDVREIIGGARLALRRVLSERSIVLRIEDGDELIHTDAALLEQILVNLFENAAKYSPAGTPIEIEGRRQGREYELSVCDHGPGIPLVERKQIFDLFRRARAADQKPAGTGMGLAICKGFAEALGGSIQVAEGPGGQGACFRIRLPQPSGMPSLRGQAE